MTKSAILVAHSQYRFLLSEIARRLRAEAGWKIHLFCASPQEAEFYKARHECFDSIETIVRRYALVDQPVSEVEEKDILARCSALEASLGITMGDVVMTDRHFGRGFALGGFRHPRSRYSRASYPQILRGFADELTYWVGHVDRIKPDLVINGGKVLGVIARARGVPYRYLAGSRYKNFHNWAHDEYFENPGVEVAFEQLAKQGGTSLMDEPYNAHMNIRTRFLDSMRLPKVLRSMASQVVRRGYAILRGYEKAKGYNLFGNLAYLWRQRQDYVRLTSDDCVKLEQLRGSKFVFFPLHTEPEIALQQLSPEYFYQLSTIAAIARDLPAEYTLVVKDTFAAIGRRPPAFYDQIREFKNVLVMDMMELGLEVVRESAAVLTISGTAGFEGAVIGKPVISFGRHNLYNFLPHVFQVRQDEDLRRALNAALSPNFPAEKARADGMRFLEAVKAVSFDLHGYDYTKPDQVNPAAVTVAVDSLLASLPAAGEPVAA